MRREELFADPLNMVVCGVGGQGNVLASRLIGRSLARQGYKVTIGETYGLSQRGGAVMSHVRVSMRRTCGPLIPLGCAHIILGLEPMETLRILGNYGNPQVATITNTRPILPVTVGMGITEYPDDEQLRKAISRLSGRVWFLNASKLALELGAGRLLNMVMMGALTGLALLPITDTQFEEVLRERFPDDKVTPNLQAFRMGLSYMQEAISSA